MAVAHAFRVHVEDNVATLLEDAEPHAAVLVRGEGGGVEVEAMQAIRAGHKIALRALHEGDSVIKYGCPIGTVSQSVAAGEWVHLQNCRSSYDVLSSELDLESGTRTGTRYV